jgi:lipoprotein-anchoring transpeptidase ErfK/SrfK
VIAVVAALALPAAALAQTPPVPPVPTPTPTPTPTPIPPPQVQGKLKLKIEKTYRDDGRHVALTKQAWRIRGTLRPYVAGQTVLVRLVRDGKQIHQQNERLQPLPGGKVGFFQTPWKANRDGRIVISAVHRATPELDTVRSEKERVLVVKPIAGNGGVVVRLLQRGLSKLHYVTSRNGIYDDATARAVMAWRKVTGMARTFSPSEAVVRGVLAGRGKFKVRYPKHGHHVEADLSRQVLALVNRGEVERIYHISSGKPSTPTVLGSFKVYRKSPGTNSHGMVHSSYFIGGYAIHGYASVPAYAASHGCLRVPIPNAWSIYTWVRMGDIVDVYP